MGRYVFPAHQYEDQAQLKGFILLRWNKNVNFSFFDRSLVDPVKSKDEVQEIVAAIECAAAWSS